jgi:hypothetical protein
MSLRQQAVNPTKPPRVFRVRRHKRADAHTRGLILNERIDRLTEPNQERTIYPVRRPFLSTSLSPNRPLPSPVMALGLLKAIRGRQAELARTGK